MTGKTHQIFGQELALGIAILLPIRITFLNMEVMPILGMLGVSFGSLVSDVDIESSTLGRKVKFIAQNIPHRSPITHSWLIPGITLIVMSLLGFVSTIDSVVLTVTNSIIYGFFIGVCSHVFADLWNKKGEKLFWPLYNKPVHIACIKTGTKQESVWLFFISVIWWWYVLFEKARTKANIHFNIKNKARLLAIGLFVLFLILLIIKSMPIIKNKCKIQKKESDRSQVKEIKDNKIVVKLIGKVIIYNNIVKDTDISFEYKDEVYKKYGKEFENMNITSDDRNHYILFLLNDNSQIAQRETNEDSYNHLSNLAMIKVNKNIFKVRVKEW